MATPNPLDPTNGLVKSMQLGDYISIGIVTAAWLLLMRLVGR